MNSRLMQRAVVRTGEERNVRLTARSAADFPTTSPVFRQWTAIKFA